MNKFQRDDKIRRAESNGFLRCQPYLIIGIKEPRWYWKGGYYHFSELPL